MIPFPPVGRGSSCGVCLSVSLIVDITTQGGGGGVARPPVPQLLPLNQPPLGEDRTGYRNGRAPAL